ncbi:MAG: class I SAM-dependent methyltransferase [Erysipelotrichaceae bacterium]|nr:class I SAM-dependent methyltransferase [Erysipelotrichaceae bacterium]MBQ6492722.1 class I SAM-dependent methyltransferase [Erysipelotrichaceae bacterium]
MNNNTFVHKYIKSLIGKDDVTADLTAGNGNDTLFLSQLSKKVYAFDISAEAIASTKEKITGRDNVILVHDSHAQIDQYVKEKLRLAIFNLGYLPHGKEYSVTSGPETLIAVEKSYELLESGGYLIITFYLSHQGGRDEYYLLQDHIQKNRLTILETYSQDKTDSPITYIIRKD